MCVGGSTVVNNAVCIRAPDDVLDRWNDPNGLNAGLDRERLNDSYSHIESWLRVRRQPERVFAGGAKKFLAGVDDAQPQGPGASGRGEHRRLPRLRLLQHRL